MQCIVYRFGDGHGFNCCWCDHDVVDNGTFGVPVGFFDYWELWLTRVVQVSGCFLENNCCAFCVCNDGRKVDFYCVGD